MEDCFASQPANSKIDAQSAGRREPRLQRQQGFVSHILPSITCVCSQLVAVHWLAGQIIHSGDHDRLTEWDFFDADREY
jgi:hypothetical protein